MFRKALIYFTLPLLLLIGISWKTSGARDKTPEGQTGTLEKMIVTRGNVVMDLDLNRLNGAGGETTGAKLDPLRFEVNPSSFFTILVFDHVLRGPETGSMELIWDNSAALPELLNASANQLVIEKIASDQAFDLVVRDGKTGFVFFNIEGHLYEYNAAARSLQHQGRQSADFGGICEQAWASGGRWRVCGENLDRDDHVGDRSHHGGQWRGPIVDPAIPAAGLRKSPILSRDRM